MSERPRIGTFTDVLGLMATVDNRIEREDPDFDDWVFRTSNACHMFVETMNEIGLVLVKPEPKRGLFGRWKHDR